MVGSAGSTALGRLNRAKAPRTSSQAAMAMTAAAASGGETFEKSSELDELLEARISENRCAGSMAETLYTLRATVMFRESLMRSRCGA